MSVALVRRMEWGRVLEPVQASAADPLGKQPSILARRQRLIRGTSARKQQLPRFPAALQQVVVQRLACDLGQLEADGPTRFALADSCSVDRVAVGCHVVHRSATRSQPRSLLSIARLNIARSRVRRSSCNLARIDHTCPRRNGGFGPVSLPLFQAGRRGLAVCDEGLLSFMVGLLFKRPPSLRWPAPAR